VSRLPLRAALRLLLVAVLAFGLSAAPMWRWVPSAAAQGRTVSLNQKRARIEEVIAKVGEAIGRTILVPDDVRGTISIVARRPLEVEEAWALLESALSILGYSLLPSTVQTWRVAKVAEAVGEAPFRLKPGTDSDSFVTTLIPLRVADHQDVLKVLEPLSGSRVQLVPYAETNSLIASGSEQAIARLTDLAGELDQVEERGLRIRTLRYRDVEDVEALVEGFLEAGDVALSRVQVWSDVRTNSLAIRGGPVGVARVLAFLEQVDEPVQSGGSIRILRVLHRDPEEVAELIRALAEPNRGGGSIGRGAAVALDGANYSIAVDAPTRSLVVRGAADTQVAIREVLELLDVPPQLLAVDITVSEIRTPEAYGLSFGFQLPFAAGSDTNDLFGVVTSSPGLPSGVEPAFFGRVQRDSGVSFETSQGGIPVTVPILQTGTIAAVDFEATNEVLIQPSLIVTAGEEHEIFVGDNIPIPVQDNSVADGAGGIPQLSVTTRFDRQDIGTRLAFEARAGTQGKIQLDLEIEISSIDETRAGIAGDPTVVGPSFLEKRLVVSARLDDGESAVLAVDNGQTETRARSGVPLLQDLPLLGWLFRSEGSRVDAVRLIIAARVRRVSNPSELVADTIRRRLAFERRSARVGGLPSSSGSPYGVRVTTRLRQDDAEAIGESLSLRGYETLTHHWSSSGADYYDVYVTSLDSMVDAAAVAERLSVEGWQSDIVVLPERS